MHVETHMQSVTITEIPNAENLTSLVVNLQDMTVEMIYKGYEHRPVTYETAARYDGELDDPRMPTRPAIGEEPAIRPRPVRDNPQA